MLDPVWLRSFLAVADTGGFTSAAKLLDLRQSTVSGHVVRLEETINRRLFVRDTHSVTLTADGTAMLGLARQILRTHEQAMRYFDDSAISGTVRFGASQDLVVTGLPRVLEEFRSSHPRIDLELVVGLTADLQRLLETNQLDLIFGKRPRGQRHGIPVFSDILTWATSPYTRITADEPVPLVAYPQPSVSRAMGLRALEQAHRSYRITCTAESIIGLQAAVLAGFGVVPYAKSLMPDSFVEASGLPQIGVVDFILARKARPARTPEKALVDAIQRNVHRFRSPVGNTDSLS